MTIPATVPVTITPEAATFVEDKGYRCELEQMIGIRDEIKALRGDIAVPAEVNPAAE